MWKYVTRRIRDSVERTYNVLETRRTWTCGGAEKNNGPPCGAADDQADASAAYGGCAGGYYQRNVAVVQHAEHEHWHSDGSSWPSWSSSSSSDDQQRDDFRRRHNRCHEQGALGALSWSGAIVAGWYTSQLVSMRRRQRNHARKSATNSASNGGKVIGGGDSGASSFCPMARMMAAKPASASNTAGGMFAHWMHTAAAPNSAHDEWLERVLRSVDFSDGVRLREPQADVLDVKNVVQASGVFEVQNDRVMFGNEGAGRDEVDCRHEPIALPPQSAQAPQAHVKTASAATQQTPAPPSPPSAPAAADRAVDGAVRDLLKVIGDIEFQLGVQHMQDERFDVAATHFKLGTGHQHAGATFNLGLCYELGIGVPRSSTKALECYVMAAEMGHPKALYNVGVFHVQGRAGLSKNRRVAREFFVAAARLGQEDAQRALGMAGDREGEEELAQSKRAEYVPQSAIFKAVAVA